MRVDWCVSSWFRIKNTHSLTHTPPSRRAARARAPSAFWYLYRHKSVPAPRACQLSWHSLRGVGGEIVLVRFPTVDDDDLLVELTCSQLRDDSVSAGGGGGEGVEGGLTLVDEKTNPGRYFPSVLPSPLRVHR